jgi:diacylglycerol kinase family enzyme
MRKVDAVILNPYANAGNGAKRWRTVQNSPDGIRLGLSHAPLFDAQPNELGDWVKEKYGKGSRFFVVAGGDGTLHSSLNTCLALDLPEAVYGAIGVGSSNDFQKPYTASGRGTIAGYHARLDFEKASLHDIGTLDCVLGGLKKSRFFFINASLGVTAEANDLFNRGEFGISALKRVWVEGAIVLAALATFATYRNTRALIRLDASLPEAEIEVTNLGMIKNRFFSGSFHYDLAPGPDDGMLGVHLCKEMGRIQMLKTLFLLSQGKFSGRPNTLSRFSKAITIQRKGKKPLIIETDGEISYADSCAIGLAEKRIRLCP